MTILRENILGSPNVGIFALTTDLFTIVPTGLTDRKIARISDALNTEVFSLDIGYSKLIGVLAATTSSGVALPHYTADSEIRIMKKYLKAKVKRVDSYKTAFGNLVLANDNGALISPLFNAREIELIKSILNVDVAMGCLAGSPFTGSVAVANNKGAIVHPNATEEEKKLAADILKVPITVGTVNGGVPFVSSGLLINSYGAVTGTLTTGPELMNISSIV